MQPEALIHRWFAEVWNQGNEQTVDELYGENALAHGLWEGDAQSSGREGVKAFLRQMRGAFPDVRMTVQETITEGNRISARVQLDATHTGDGLGVAPTQRRVRVIGIVMVHVENGQIAESWNSWDQLAMLRQLGLVPSAPDNEILAYSE